MAAELIYIFGAGGRGREIEDVVADGVISEAYKFAGFLDDYAEGTSQSGSKIFQFGAVEIAAHKVVIGIGEPSVRLSMYKKVIAAGAQLLTVASRKSNVSERAVVGRGVIISPFVSIQGDAVIGDNVDLNTGSIVGHDVRICDNSVISSQVNLGGGVRLGNCCYVGMGTLIKEGLSIGEGSIIGMGSVVYDDIPEGVIALGNPARVVKRNVDGIVFRRKYVTETKI